MPSPDLSAPFTWKDLAVDWEKVDRVSTLVDAALDSRRNESDIICKARRLEQFYPFLVCVAIS
jgi:hypothetical protein